MTRLVILCIAAVWACGGEEELPDAEVSTAPPDAFELPVLTNPSVPIAYPPTLFEDGVEGTVVLRLYVDEAGEVVPESTVVAEGSGYPQLDSAALAGVDRMQFAPARRAGAPVATIFLQPVHFRRTDAATGGVGRQ